MAKEKKREKEREKEREKSDQYQGSTIYPKILSHPTNEIPGFLTSNYNPTTLNNGALTDITFKPSLN
jgi:hypothetical protein